MAKDPAFLFYSADFMMGTALMSETEVGQYTRIMCHMHQSGHLSMEDMKNICPNISPRVVAKFSVDDKGLYYQRRLEFEIQKRKNYSESRRNNRLKNKSESYDSSHEKHMSPHMENENENRNENGFVTEYKEESSEKKIVITVPRESNEHMTEEWFAQIFDSAYMGSLTMPFRILDLQQELADFKIKVRGAPGEYKRDSGGIRNAFLYQLRKSREKKTGKPVKVVSQDRMNEFKSMRKS